MAGTMTLCVLLLLGLLATFHNLWSRRAAGAGQQNTGRRICFRCHVRFQSSLDQLQHFAGRQFTGRHAARVHGVGPVAVYLKVGADDEGVGDGVGGRLLASRMTKTRSVPAEAATTSGVASPSRS